MVVKFAVETAKLVGAPYVVALVEVVDAEAGTHRLMHMWYTDSVTGDSIFDEEGEDLVSLIPHNWSLNSKWEYDGNGTMLLYMSPYEVDYYLDMWYSQGLEAA